MTKLILKPGDRKIGNVVFGNRNAPILVICDSPPMAAWNAGQVMGQQHMEVFSKAAKEAGLGRDDFCFITPCPTIPAEMYNSEKRKADWLARHKEEFEALLQTLNYRAVVVCGNLAARAYLGRATKIMKVRGLPIPHRDKPCIPTLSCGYVAKVADLYPMLKADLATVGRLKAANFRIEEMQGDTTPAGYKYSFDLEEILDAKPKLLAADTETTGLVWHKPEIFPFLAQLTYKKGHSTLVPLCDRYIPEGLDPAKLPKALKQLKQIMEDPDIHKVGHNFKYDIHMFRKLDIDVKGWRHDTMQMAYTVDENMRSFGLDDCTRVWVPEMAGYDDELRREYGYDDMISIPPDVMARYAGGDTDACFRLCRNLMALLQGQPDHYRRYTHIVMPALTMFAKVTEPYGVEVDPTQLAKLKIDLKNTETQMYEDLLTEAPVEVKRDALKGNYADLGSLKFIREILFTEKGFDLRPIVFTKAENLPSTSTKDHLVYFEGHPWVDKYVEYVKLKKLNGTYVETFEKYITDGCIHPSFHMHRTNTGRVASSDPNGQNFPKRGDLATQYRKMFVARKGYVIIEADYAQVELKLAAIASRDRNMINAYKTFGDLHVKTAADTMGLTVEQFLKLDKKVQKTKRFQAKAINFGFIYGMSAGGFKTYAKTQYLIDYTEEEAENFRNTFFRSYPSLTTWHTNVKAMAHKNGQVTSLHGCIRHLPAIYSKDKQTVSLTERQSVNAPIQLLGSDLLLMAATRFSRDIDPEEARVILTVHDAAIIEAREDRADYYAGVLKWYLENNPIFEWFGMRFPISLDAEVAIGPTYGETSEDAGKHITAIQPEGYDPDRDALSPMRFMSLL